MDDPVRLLMPEDCSTSPAVLETTGYDSTSRCLMTVPADITTQLTVSGNISPVLNGIFRQNGPHNGQPAYQCQKDGLTDWWIYYDDTDTETPGRWILGQNKQVTQSGVPQWYSEDLISEKYPNPWISSKSGVYYPNASASGIAIIDDNIDARGRLVFTEKIIKNQTQISNNGDPLQEGKIYNGQIDVPIIEVNPNEYGMPGCFYKSNTLADLKLMRDWTLLLDRNGNVMGLVDYLYQIEDDGFAVAPPRMFMKRRNWLIKKVGFYQTFGNAFYSPPHLMRRRVLGYGLSDAGFPAFNYIVRSNGNVLVGVTFNGTTGLVLYYYNLVNRQLLWMVSFTGTWGYPYGSFVFQIFLDGYNTIVMSSECYDDIDDEETWKWRKFDSNGNLVAKSNSPIVRSSPHSHAADIAPDGSVWLISDKKLYRIDPSDLSATIISSSDYFNLPIYDQHFTLRIDSSGYLYIAGYRVQLNGQYGVLRKFDTSMNLLWTFDHEAVSDPGWYPRAWNFTIDKKTDDLYLISPLVIFGPLRISPEDGSIIWNLTGKLPVTSYPNSTTIPNLIASDYGILAVQLYARAN